jgi:hypothetical protein
MSSPVIKITSYMVNNRVIRGSFPIYIKGASQCCINGEGYQVITPIAVNVRKIQK